MKWIYDIGIQLYTLAIKIAATFGNPKAQKWRAGRKTIFKKMAGISKQSIWIHAASLGEFEQGRPLIEAIKKENPQQKILLTFFSPSGYEIRKDYPLADYVFYLPIDTAKNATRFIEIVQPKIAIFIKYEFWHYYIKALHDNQIPIYSVSAVFREQQVFFKWYGDWYRKILDRFTHIFVQNKDSLELLHRFGLKNASVAGDTRVDRVLSIKERARIFPIIETFTSNRPTLICGSTWLADEKIIAEYIGQHEMLPFKIIIAPHSVRPKRIAEIQALFSERLDIVLYSAAQSVPVSKAQILIIDNIGMLSSIYRYGQIAYIGGGFQKGLHNTLEPIAFGLPVVFGTHYQKFEEAKWLVENSGGFSIDNYTDFENIINQLLQADFYKKASKVAFAYVTENQGVTENVLHRIMEDVEIV